MKKKLWFYLLMLLLSISLSHCEDMPTRSVPTVETKPITDIISGTAKSGGNISDDGGAFITRKGVCWDLTSGLTLDNCTGFTFNGPGMCNYISTISGLEEGKTYFVRAYATNSEGTGYGASETFMTKLTAIAITTSASSIKLNTATLNGTVNPNGENTTVTFEYGLYTSYGSTVSAIQSPISGTSVVAVSADLINLAEGSLYHYRVVADNSGGEKTGGDQTFSTRKCPSAYTDWAVDIKSNSATLAGGVWPNGEITTVQFEYGKTTGYGASMDAFPSPVSGTGYHEVYATISNLAAGQEYHYRVIAKSDLCGTITGNDEIFATSSKGAYNGSASVSK